MRIKDCRYRVVCSRSEEILRFTNLTTVLRFSLIHQLPIFDDGSLPSSFVFLFFKLISIEPRRATYFFDIYDNPVYPSPVSSMYKVDYLISIR